MQRAEEHKIAHFENPEEKTRYVDAESQDFKCRELWYQYHAARTLEERKEIAVVLDNTRWNFYKRWSNSRPQEPNPTTDIFDDIIA